VPGTLYILDSCSLLNLIASRRLDDIVPVVRGEFLVPDLVADEVKYVRRGGSGPDAREREPVDIGDLLVRRILTVSRLEGNNELASFVTLAASMDDGEAAAGALAVNRRGTLVTDDRRAQHIMSQQYPAVPLLTTSELVKSWVDAANIERTELRQVLTDIEERGNFRPGSADPLVAWWQAGRGPP
jgi:predicted nucleic acid-binding protein